MLRYAITDGSRSTSSGFAGEYALHRQVERLTEAGVDYIQLREKDLGAGALASLARRLLTLLRSTQATPKLLINTRVDVAVAVGADGVHLPASAGGLTPTDVREIYAAAGLREPIVSISCHTLDEVKSAVCEGATLILFGPVYEKVVRVNENGVWADAMVAEGTGLDHLRLACAAAAPTPVLALGGINAENTSAVIAAGAAGVAGIRLFSM